IVGFADDIAIVTVAKHLTDIEAKTNTAVKAVRDWLEGVGLRLAEHKTEAVLVTSRKKVEFVNIVIGDTTIRSQATMTYLGVKVDNRLNFRAHLM
ncbi:hypothetical protein KR044_011996, partial [Drosophila immigrans]